MLFIDTLKAPYYDRMISNATKNFVDIVTFGEMIENIVKSGKIENVEVQKDANVKRKEGEMHVVTH